jgi:hypothetical protein
MEILSLCRELGQRDGLPVSHGSPCFDVAETFLAVSSGRETTTKAITQQ